MPGVKTRRVRQKIKLPTSFTGHSKVKVGFPSGVSNDIVMRAIYNNYGTSEKVNLVGGGKSLAEIVPERPFLDNAIRDNRAKYGRMMRAASVGIINGSSSVTSVMRKIGIEATGDIQDEIVNLRTPENAPSTVKQKKSSNPLVASGEMKGAVTHQTYD